MVLKKEYQYLCRNDDDIMFMPLLGNESNKNAWLASVYFTFLINLPGWLWWSWFWMDFRDTGRVHTVGKLA